MTTFHDYVRRDLNKARAQLNHELRRRPRDRRQQGGGMSAVTYWPLVDAVRVFIGEHETLRDLVNDTGAAGLCIDFSEELVRWVAERYPESGVGLIAEVNLYTRQGDVELHPDYPQFPSTDDRCSYPELAGAHYVAIFPTENGQTCTCVDLTARQFDEDLPFPLIWDSPSPEWIIWLLQQEASTGGECMSFDVTHSKKFEINGITVYHEIADTTAGFRHRLAVGDQAYDPVGYTDIAVGQTEDGTLVCACIPDYWGNTVPEVFVATPATECDSARKED